MSVNGFIFLAGLLILASIGVAKFSSKFGITSLVLFLVVGLVIGPEFLDLLRMQDPRIVKLITYVGLVVILFESGLHTDAENLKIVFLPSFTLSTLGIFLTTILFAIATSYLLNVSIHLGLLMGAVVSSTEAATIFSRLGASRIPKHLRQTLEAESGMSNLVAIFLTGFMLDYNFSPETFSFLKSLQSVVMQVGVGIVSGLIIGELLRRSLRLIQFDGSDLYSILLISGSLLAYGLTTLALGSGFIAVYLTGILLKEEDIPYWSNVLVFQDRLAWLIQVSIFILLGILVKPSQIFQVNYSFLLLPLILIFLIRPFVILVSTTGMDYTLKERLLISWGGVRSAITIFLAMFPIAEGLPGNTLILRVVFYVVLISSLLQGWSVMVVARWLGQQLPGSPPESVDIKFLNFNDLQADMIEIGVPPDSSMEGKTVRSLNLPEKCILCAVIRNDRFITPKGHTKLESKDTIFLIVEHSSISQVENILSLPGVKR